ncbi:MAG: glycosyltransferase family 4 protein [Candidatus Latescibacteria bacterium]|jgi:glycosyltransferase involved in cell wall biosynthesis|nr:glycosyltransferase family 4 protein [Candidatus Latescibacterota bacterium]MBT4139301.1 glycosyltransferase family 4 protein [Candidatus Latescibacterota bacterium]MBT5832311.1 glycosyltransferase family 4 protein [Candidatus Latescibacterota bacterium]
MAKILYVITRLAVGGAPRTMLTAIQGLKKVGYEITLVSGYPGLGEGSLVDEARLLDVELIFIPTLQRELHPWRDLISFWRLWRLMRKRQFDLVHTHLSKAGILGRLAAFFSRTRVVHTFHGDVLNGYFSPMKSNAFLVVERVVGRMTDRFICVSTRLKERLLHYHLGDDNRFCVITNGIDMRHSETIGQRVAHTNRVGTLAMFYPIKRLDLFVEMAHQLKQCNTEIQCDIAGDGMTAIDIKQQAKQLGDPVRFVGVCEDPSAFLSQLDVFVLCSDYESSGMGVMEAMSMGLPVVATAVGGIPEIIQDGHTGVLVDAGDVEGLCQAVRDLLQNPEKREQMGALAKTYAQTHFSVSAMTAELDALYCELLP